jgi:hypothetical protein
MRLLGRLYPDHKSIAEFRRVHRDAVTALQYQVRRTHRDGRIGRSIRMRMGYTHRHQGLARPALADDADRTRGFESFARPEIVNACAGSGLRNSVEMSAVIGSAGPWRGGYISTMREPSSREKVRRY